MDYVEGVNVRDIIQEEGKLSEEEALAITLQIAKALQHAYENNIIHRDIKPENIMVDSEGRARLCDLGLAREASEDSPLGALTQAGIVLGTPYYVSPEQAEGKRDLDTRSDIYSLGISLFHMVTGSVPFRGSSGPAIMVKHMTEKMPDPREFNPKLSNGTVQLIRKMTAKKREQRYQNPDELVSDIELVIKGERPAAAGPVIRARKRKAPGAFREDVVIKTGGGKKLVPLLVVAVLVLVVVVVLANLASEDNNKKQLPPYKNPGSSADSSSPGGENPVANIPDRQPLPDNGGSSVETPNISDDQREIMQIIEWARKNQDKTDEIARRYVQFIDTASDPSAVKDARQALEGVAAREFLTLDRKCNSLLATGKAAEALEEVESFLKLFAKTNQSEKAQVILKKAREERDRKYKTAIAGARELANNKKFDEALAAIKTVSNGAPEDLESLITRTRKEIEEERDKFVAESRARADSTRPEFEAKLVALVDDIKLDSAAQLVEERLEIETQTEKIKALREKASDLRDAAQAVALVMSNLANLKGLKQTFNIDRKGNEQGIVEEVRDTSFIFTSGPVSREVKLVQLNPDDIIRLAELNLGAQPARARYRLGLLFLAVLGHPEEARLQFKEARKMGMDTSRFDDKIAVSYVREALEEAEGHENRKRYLDAALAYSKALDAISETDSYPSSKIDEIKNKVETCLRESGAKDAFAGKVTVEKGKLAVTYDFSEPGQWKDFEGYVWDERIKRENVTEWMVSNNVMVGKGSEGVIWKGKFDGDVSLEVEVTPKSPGEPRFFLKICDDGRGSRGKNYTFAFSYWLVERQPVGRRGNKIIYRDVKKTLGHYIARLRGSSNKYDYLKQGLNNPLVKANNTYRLKVEKEGDFLRMFINDAKIYEVEDDDYDRGGISLKVTDSTVHFDNLKVTGEFDESWLRSELRKAK